MQSNFYTKNVTNSPTIGISSKDTPILPPLDEEDYSNNVLNIGFIC